MGKSNSQKHECWQERSVDPYFTQNYWDGGMVKRSINTFVDVDQDVDAILIDGV